MPGNRDKTAKKIESVIEEVLRRPRIQQRRIAVAKIGSFLHSRIASALEGAGFWVDDEDEECRLLEAKVPAWRESEGDQLVSKPTKNRRKIDIVVYFENGELAGLIEVESDLDHLQEEPCGQSHEYAVYSMGSTEKFGSYFYSYKSLERMAVAAYGMYLRQNKRVRDNDSMAGCQAICSVLAEDHNPLAVPIFLVVGSCTDWQRKMLAPRLDSLDARLICGSDFN